MKTHRSIRAHKAVWDAVADVSGKSMGVFIQDHMLDYLRDNDYPRYVKVCAEIGIRPLSKNNPLRHFIH